MCLHQLVGIRKTSQNWKLPVSETNTKYWVQNHQQLYNFNVFRLIGACRAVMGSQVIVTRLKKISSFDHQLVV